MKKLLLFFFILFIHSISFAQNDIQDSLKLRELNRQISKSNDDSIAIITHDILKKNISLKRRVHAYSILRVHHRVKSNNDSAIYYAEKTINILRGEKDSVYQKFISDAYRGLGVVYTNQGLFDKSLGYHLKGLKIAENINNIEGIVNHKSSIANIYVEKKQYDKAAAMHEEIISTYKQHLSPSSIIT